MKFRAYDKQEKKLYKPDTMGELFHLFALTMDGRLGRFNEDLGKYETCDPDRYAVEFTTGLKDKNGVEIYEGDILGGCNGSINGHGITEKWKVYWSKARAEFQMPLWVYDKDGEYSYGDSTHWFEIIGNIHDGETDGKARVSNFNFL